MEFFRRSRRRRRSGWSGRRPGDAAEIYIPPLERGSWRGEPHSWTTWTERVPMRLPRAEAIGLTNAVGQLMMRRWEDVEAVCGLFSEDPGSHPPRFRPPPWPDNAAWERLRTEFAPPVWAPDDDDTSRI